MPDAIVAQTSDLEDGQMKQVQVGDTDVLLCRVGGSYYAIAAHCNHYGAPLVDGVLSGNRVVCPWHHACFRVENGGLLEPPALNDQTSYDVSLRGDNVVVHVPDDADDAHAPDLPAGSERPGGARADTDARMFAIVGAGAAGNAAAEELRRVGFAGRVVLISREARLPYDRPNLSKDYLAGEAEDAWMPLRSENWYAAHAIELWLGREVTSVDVATRTITFDDSDTLTPDALLLAPGATPRTLDVPGANLDNVVPLRTFDDADALIEAAKAAERVVVVGASFIGMEAAAHLLNHGVTVHVVAPEEVPFAHVFGEKIGALFQAKHAAAGTAFSLGKHIARLEGNGTVERVVLDTGEALAADLVVVGIGVRPATDFIQNADRDDDGGFAVDETLRLADGVWAAGDVARFPEPNAHERVRIEHWRLAEQHGRLAAQNMAGGSVTYDSVPFFWTRQHGLSVSYVGHAEDWDDIVYDGDVDNGTFLAFYVKDNRVLACAGANRGEALAAIDECFRLGKMPSVAELRSGAIDWVARLA